MRRRTFIAGLGSAAAWPLAAWAQQTRSVRHIGMLLYSEPDDPAMQVRIQALEARLRELGWVEGHNVKIDYRWVQGDPAGLRERAVELVATKPDLIFTQATPGLAAAQHATGTIPIVFNSVTDPVAQGFVASLARPGGNSTGLGHWESAMGGKWLELLKEIASRVEHVTVMFNPMTVPYFKLFLPSMETAARSLNVTLTESRVHEAAEIEHALSVVAARPISGLIMLPDAFTWQYRARVIELAARYRMPVMYQYGHIAREGGLVSYGIDPEDVYRRTATYVDRILNGAKPADLPVQLPTKFELVINLKTAKALGLTIPETLLATADEVIQ
jgi:putative tryptophan/tyrosine transport system substrate-binding protein